MPTAREPADEEQRAPARGSMQPAGERRGEERHDRHRQEAQARLERRVPEHVLHVEREVEEHREHRRRDREGRDLGAGEGGLAEQARGRASGCDRAARRSRTRHQQHRRDGEQAEDHGAPQPSALPRIRANTRQKSPPLKVTTPAQSTRARGSRAVLVELQQRHDHGQRADRHVHEEDPLPAEALGERAAHERADGHCARRSWRPRSRRRCHARGPELLGDQRRGAGRTSPRRRSPGSRGRD